MLLRTLFIGTLVTVSAFAQMTSFPKPNYFRETFKKVETKVTLRDPIKLKDYVVSGKIELSMKQYLELVMANNTSIQINFLSIERPKNAVESAFSTWAPSATASFSSQRSKSAVTSRLDGSQTGTNSQLSQPFSASFTQNLDSGTRFNAQFSASKSTSNSSLNNYNPNFSSNMSLTITQPLLRDRGRFVNRINLMTARGNLRKAEYDLRQTLSGAVQTAENTYWALISARESLQVQESGFKLAQSNLDYAQKQLDLGAISDLDIYTPKRNKASAEQGVATARFNLLQAEDAVRQQIGADLDPEVRKLPIVLTEPVEIPNWESIAYDSEASVAAALANRPDLKSATITLDNDDLSIAQAKNGLLPQLQLQGLYRSAGQGGVYRSLTGGFGEEEVLTVIPGGLGDAFSKMFGFNLPTYQVGLTLTLPIRNRAASIAMANALIQKKSDSLNLRNQQQSIRLNVLNQITSLNGAKEQLKLARTNAEFSRLDYDAMQKKYELGTETLTNLVNAQERYTQAQSSVVTQQISLQRSVTSLLYQTGELLDKRGIIVQ